MQKLHFDRFLMVILLMAFALRLPGIFDGLPAVYNSTEYFLSKLALSMGARKSLDPYIQNYAIYTPRLFIYPMFYEYVLLIEYGMLFLIGKIFSVFKDQYDFAVRFLIDPSIFYIVSRLVNLAISVLTIHILYKKMFRLFDKITARFAAIFAVLSYYLILTSQQSISDSWLIFFSSLAILYAMQTLHKFEIKSILLAGLFSGLATGTKYNAGLLVLVLAALYILNWKNIKQNYLKTGILIILSFFAGFLIPNPYWLFSFSRFFEGYQLISSQAVQAVALEQGFNYWWEFSEIFRHELIIGLGFFIATVYAIYKRKPVHLVLLPFVLITFFYVGSWQKKGVDYLYALFPAWIILLAMWCKVVVEYFNKKKNLQYLFVILLIVPSLLMGIYQSVLRINQDTREQATEWIKQNVSKQEKICYDYFHYDLGIFDINRFIGYGAGATQLPQTVKERLQNFRSHSDNFSLVPILEKISSEKSQAGSLFEEELSQYRRKSIAHLGDENVKYIITNEYFYKPYLAVDAKDYPKSVQGQISEIRKMYKYLLEEMKPIKLFKPDFWTPGPEIRIYNLSI